MIRAKNPPAHGRYPSYPLSQRCQWLGGAEQHGTEVWHPIAAPTLLSGQALTGARFCPRLWRRVWGGHKGRPAIATVDSRPVAAATKKRLRVRHPSCLYTHLVDSTLV